MKEPRQRAFPYNWFELYKIDLLIWSGKEFHIFFLKIIFNETGNYTPEVKIKKKISFFSVSTKKGY